MAKVGMELELKGAERITKVIKAVKLLRSELAKLKKEGIDITVKEKR